MFDNLFNITSLECENADHSDDDQCPFFADYVDNSFNGAKANIIFVFNFTSDFNFILDSTSPTGYFLSFYSLTGLYTLLFVFIIKTIVIMFMYF